MERTTSDGVDRDTRAEPAGPSPRGRRVGRVPARFVEEPVVAEVSRWAAAVGLAAAPRRRVGCGLRGRHGGAMERATVLPGRLALAARGASGDRPRGDRIPRDGGVALARRPGGAGRASRIVSDGEERAGFVDRPPIEPVVPATIGPAFLVARTAALGHDRPRDAAGSPARGRRVGERCPLGGVRR